MRAVILDADTITGEDVSLDPICSLADTVVYGTSLPDEIPSRIGNAEIVLTNKCRIDKAVFEKCPNIRFIGVFATGYNNIDINAAAESGCIVSNVPGYSTAAVAQHTMALILHYYSKISAYDSTVKNGDWCYSKLFTYFDIPIHEIAGKTIGIIGYGSIGRAVKRIAAAFDMKVLVYTRTSPEPDDEIESVSLNELLKRSDIVSLHCPLNSGTEGLINKDTLAMMKRSAILINTSRGGVINEHDLANALNNGEIAAAGLDVLRDEPMSELCPLRAARNCYFTPHIAWAPIEARIRLIERVRENLAAFLNGSPINNVAVNAD